MNRDKVIEYGGPSGVEVLEYDHEDTGCPVYSSYEGDLFVKVFPDGSLREILPCGHHGRAH